MAARPLPKSDTTPKITIGNDGTWDHSVTINPGDTVEFDLPNYKSGYNQCMVHFTISWGSSPKEDPPGTIVIGS